MTITNKKLDSLRRLLLGNLYQDCKDNPMGVSRERLGQHLQKLKEEGCVGDCNIDVIVKTCRLKTHYPSCVDGKNRDCVEDIGERSTGVDKFHYNKYKTSKMFENEPDTDEEKDEEGDMCNVCGLTGDDDIGQPVKEMSCGHHSHVNCLIRISKQKGRDNGECPECRKEFSLLEVSIPVRTVEQRQSDSSRRSQFNASQIHSSYSSEEEETEEDRIFEGIGNLITNNNINRAIEELRNFFTTYEEASYNNVILLFNKIVNKIEFGQIDTHSVKSLVNIIVEGKLVNINRRLVNRINQIIQRGTQTQKEQCIYAIMKIADNLIVNFPEEDDIELLLENIIKNDAHVLLKVVMKVAEDNNAVTLLKRALNNNINALGIEDEITKRIISRWFTRHNFNTPVFQIRRI